jgi:hypothetical protein
MPFPCHPPRLDHSVRRRVQVMQCCRTSRHFVSLRWVY